MTQLNPLVSVVVPFFNRETTIQEAIESVLQQDYDPIEVIAVDDGSTDNTISVVKSISDPRVKVLYNPHQDGVSAARNFGIKHSSGPWIAFQDSDDVWLPGKLKKQMDRLISSEDIASYCGMLIKTDTLPDTPVIGRIPSPEISPLSGDILPSLIKDSYISTQMLVIKKEILDHLGGFDENISALVDWELMIRVACQGTVDFVDNDLVVQRMSDNSITRSPDKRVHAQQYILEKHSLLIERYNGALAQHNHRLAGAMRAKKQYKKALPHAWAAWRAQRQNIRYLLNALFIQFKSIFNK